MLAWQHTPVLRISDSGVVQRLFSKTMQPLTGARAEVTSSGQK